MPEAELPLAYSAHYPWGSLHVTETAAEEYSLVPLQPVVEGGELLKRTKTDDGVLRKSI